MNLRFISCLLPIFVMPAWVNAQPTVIVDFKEPFQGNTTAITGTTVGSFNFAAYGFANNAANFTLLTNAIMVELRKDYFGLPTTNQNPLSPIPQGMELNVNFMVGDIGTSYPFEHYFVQVGSYVSGSGAGSLGIAQIDAVRARNGTHPGSVANGSVVASVFTDALNGLTGLTPANALTSGNLQYSALAIDGTLAHEIGHTLSLFHVYSLNSTQPGGSPPPPGTPSLIPTPLLGTGALDLPNQDRIEEREFSLAARETANGPFVNQVGHLVSSLGLRPAPVPEPTTLTLIVTVGGVSGMLAVFRRREKRRA